MDRSSTLYCIAICLNYLDLTRLAQVNRLCRTVATRNDLWKAECIRICTVTCDFFQVISESETSEGRKAGKRDWKGLFTGVLKANRLWKGEFGVGRVGEQAGFHVAETLRRPELPCPRLSREGSTYSTSSQQLFADALKDCEQPGHCGELAGLEGMQARADSLLAEVAGHVEEELLLKARWVLRDSSLPFLQSQAAILRFYYCVKRTIQTHCHFVCAVLDESSTLDALLVGYCTQWAAFSAACTHLEADLRGFTNLLNDIYEAKFPNRNALPRFSMTKLMTILWRRAVFYHFQEDLLRAAECTIPRAHRDPQARDKMQVLAQALLDLSVDEYTVHMLQHSQVQLDGPYNALQEVVLNHIRRSLRDVSDIEKCTEVYTKELQWAESVYLPVTCRLMSELLAAKELSLLTCYFQSLVHSPAWRLQARNSEDSLALNSAFGLFCFNLLNYQKPLVLHFLAWVLPTEASKVALFNDLSEAQDSQALEDEWIERKATQLFRLPVSIPSALRSTAHDLKRTDLSPSLQHCLA